MSAKLPFLKRALTCQNAAAQRLCEYIAHKNSNLVLSADVLSTKALLQLAEQLGPIICLLKLHIDILEDFTPDTIAQLQVLAAKYGFLLCEDRKFADIGHTVQYQYSAGIYRIADWADFVTVHSVAGPGTLAGLQKALKNNPSKQPRGVFLIAEMSSTDQLAYGVYTKATVNMAHKYPELVAGFISQTQVDSNPGYLHLTPGVQLPSDISNKECLGQCYRDPIKAIKKQHNDLVIVGRGITNANDPLKVARAYQEAAWSAYTDFC